jgi:peptide/nickel transport system substrate-binding protein
MKSKEELIFLDTVILLKNIYYSKNIEEEKETYDKIQKMIASDLPCYSLYFRTSAVLYNQKLKGDIKPTSMNIFNNIEEWYIE